MFKIFQTNIKSVIKTEKLPRLFSNMSTIDKTEINFFGKQKDWWGDDGLTKALHSMNLLRVPFIRDGILQNHGKQQQELSMVKPLHGISILDIGCGGGILSEPLARIGAKVTGLDASSDLIQIAKMHSSTQPDLKDNLTYTDETIEEHSTKNIETYDAVVASEVLEHVLNREIFVESCVKCLKPGGSIFFTTLNKTFLSWLGAIVMAENVLGILPKGTHDYEKFIAPHETQRLLEENNCRTVLLHGMFYNPCTNNWSWISRTDVSYGIHAVKF